MKIYIYPNIDSTLEVIGAFVPHQKTVDKLSQHFEIDIVMGEQVTNSDETRSTMKEKVEKGFYRAIDENTFENIDARTLKKTTIKFESDSRISPYDKAKQIIRTPVAYIQVNSIEEAKQLLAIPRKGADANLGVNERVLSPEYVKIFTDVKGYESDVDDSIHYLGLLETITDGTGQFSEIALKQLRQLNQFRSFKPPEGFVKLLDKREERKFPVLFKLTNDIARDLWEKPYRAFLSVPLLLILIPITLIYAIILILVVFPLKRWNVTREINAIFANEVTDKKGLVYYYLGKHLREDWLNDCAVHIDSFDFASGVIGLINDSFLYNESAVFHRKESISSYIDRRTDFINYSARINLLKTIVLGLFFPPSLFFTLPERWELLENQTYELAFLEEFRRFNQGDTHGVKLDMPSQLYEIGMKLLDEEKSEFAVIFLSQVRPDQTNYKEAMAECMHYYRANGDVEKATYYSTLIEDTVFLSSLDHLVSSPQSAVSLTSNGSQQNWRNNPPSDGAVTTQGIFASSESSLENNHTTENLIDYRLG